MSLDKDQLELIWETLKVIDNGVDQMQRIISRMAEREIQTGKKVSMNRVLYYTTPLYEALVESIKKLWSYIKEEAESK